MRIALVGATGFAGAPILEELITRGHSVVAVVRRESAPSNPSVEQIRADAYDQSSLEAAFKDVDAVVSAFNPGWTEPDLYDKFMRGSRNVQAATKGAGVARLVVVGGASSLYGPEGRQLIEDASIPEPYRSGVLGARDYHAEILDETDLDWAFLSPALNFGPEGPTARLGHYRVGAESPVFDADGNSAISRADLAIAVVDEVETPRHHRRRFTIGY